MPSPTPLEIGLRIRLARKRKGFSQAKCADLAGVGRPNWTRWESGRHVPGPLYREVISQLLGVDFSDLRDEEDAEQIERLLAELTAVRDRMRQRRGRRQQEQAA